MKFLQFDSTTRMQFCSFINEIKYKIYTININSVYFKREETKSWAEPIDSLSNCNELKVPSRVSFFKAKASEAVAAAARVQSIIVDCFLFLSIALLKIKNI